MTEPIEFRPGGYIPTPPYLPPLPPGFTWLHPDECVYMPALPLVCSRPDHVERHRKSVERETP